MLCRYHRPGLCRKATSPLSCRKEKIMGHQNSKFSAVSAGKHRFFLAPFHSPIILPKGLPLARTTPTARDHGDHAHVPRDMKILRTTEPGQQSTSSDSFPMFFRHGGCWLLPNPPNTQCTNHTPPPPQCHQPHLKTQRFPMACTSIKALETQRPMARLRGQSTIFSWV